MVVVVVVLVLVLVGASDLAVLGEEDTIRRKYQRCVVELLTAGNTASAHQSSPR